MRGIEATTRASGRTVSRAALGLGLVCLLCGALGCSILGIGVRRERVPETPPDAPIWLRPAAYDLHDIPVEDVVVRAEETLVEIPLHSHTIRRIAEQAMPAVVSIYTETASPYMFSLFPIPLPGLSFRLPLPGEALGSAFFIHPDGYLLSNNHVIENALSIRARTSGDRDFDVEIIARDAVLDIALLRVVASEVEFDFIPMGNSSLVGVGDSVIAIGNPLGLGHSVSQGIISQTGRELIKLGAEGGRQIEFLQTDTAINPGSSGGPLITLSGAAVGMNTAIARSAQGIAFAVPTSQILSFIEQVLSGEGIDDPRVRTR